MDASLRLEDSLNDTNQQVGVLSLSQLSPFGIGTVGSERNLHPDDDDDLVALWERSCSRMASEDGTKLTFVTFFQMLQECLVSKYGPEDVSEPRMILLKQLEHCALQYRQGIVDGDDTSTVLAAKAIRHSGSEKSKQRQLYSDRFDNYVSTFQLWEDTLVGTESPIHHSSRRFGESIL